MFGGGLFSADAWEWGPLVHFGLRDGGGVDPSHVILWASLARSLEPLAMAKSLEPFGAGREAGLFSLLEKVPALAPPYMGTSLIRNRRSLGPYRRPMARALWGSLRVSVSL